MKSKFLRRLLIAAAAVSALFAAMTVSAFACTTIYVGGNLTEEGVPIVARSEDYINSQNKLFYVSEAGEYKEGTIYHGCDYYGGFEWTMSHDSYRFTAFTADILHDGNCPECGKPGHPSYTESGTNEKGVTVSATETLSGKDEIVGNSRNGIVGVDPYRRTKTEDGKVGIEETDIPTVILSEAASAREGVELLLKIYDEYGCYGGSGLFIADQKEIWYVENCSGTQYVALKLNDDMMFLEPNMSTIGLIDLDDTENVIASDSLIEVAKEAGTFVGDEKNNTINFRDSYNRSNTANARIVNGLNFINKEYGYTSDDLVADNTRFCISNVNADDEIVDLYTNIEADREITVDDIVNYYKVDGISNTGNTDTAFFQIFSDRPVNTGTVEWVSLDTGAYNVFVPYYPLLLDETYAGYRAAVGEATKRVEEKPESGMYYRTSSSGTYTVFPENWETSYYWCFDALNNYISYAEATDGNAVSEEDKAYVLEQLEVLQQEIYDEFYAISFANTTLAAAKRDITQISNSMAEKAHLLALELVTYLRNWEAEAFSLTYVNDGEQVGTVKQYRDGDEVAAADAPTKKSGYAFQGWAVEVNSSEVVYKVGDQLTMDEDKVLYSVWKKNRTSSGGGSSNVTYTLNFQTNGGSSISSVSKNSGAAVDLSSYSTEREGYIFDGWYSDSSLTTAISSVTLSSNITVYAKWSENTEDNPSDSGEYTEIPFSDVAESSWFYDSVAYVYKKGIINGTSSTAFSPDSPVTRGMIVTILWRLEGQPSADTAAGFNDVKAGSYYENAVAWAVKNGIVNGYSASKFGPDDSITREQMAAILYRYAQYDNIDTGAGENTDS